MHDNRTQPPYVTIAVLAISSLTIMANATISPGLPGLEAAFSDVANIRLLGGLVVTLPSLMIILTAALIGTLVDRYERKTLLMIALVIYAVGGTSGLYMQSMTGLLVGRAVLGVGVAGTMTIAMTLAGDLWSGPARQRFMGIQSSAMQAGGIVLVTLGGILAGVHWRLPFAIYLIALPVGVMVLHALWRVDTRPRRAAPSTKPEAGGYISFPWLGIGPLYLLAFIFMATFYLVPTRLPFLIQDMGIGGPQTIGIALAGIMLTGVPGGLLYGRVRRYLSAKSVFAIGFSGMAAGLGVISVADSIQGVTAGTLLMGAGMGAMMPNFGTFMMANVPDAMRGRASGFLTTAIFGGQFASPLISAPVEALVGMHAVFLAYGCFMLGLAGVMAALALRDRLAGDRLVNRTAC